MALWMLAGLVLGILWQLLSGWAPGGAVFAALALFTLFFIPLRRWSGLLVWAALGVLLTVLALSSLPHSGDYLGRQVVLEVQWTGSFPRQGEDYYLWEARIVSPDDLAGGRVQVRTAEAPRHGLYVVEGTLHPVLRYRNPGQQWHYRRLVYSGWAGRLERVSVLAFRESHPGLLAGLRQGFQENVLEFMGEPGALALAVTAGDRGALGWQQSRDIYQSGLGHVTALSGMHIGVLAGLGYMLLKRTPLPEGVARLLVLLLLGLYVMFAGVRPSLLRAVLMAGYTLAAYVAVGRKATAGYSLCWAALALLCWNPLWIMDYAMLFSFFATACAVYGAPLVEGGLGFLPAVARRVAAVTVAIQVVTLPLSLLLFGGVPVLAVVANLVAVPLLPLVFASTLWVGFAGGLWPLAGAAVAVVPAILCGGLLELARLLAVGWLEVPLPVVPHVWIGLLGLLALLWRPFERQRVLVVVVAASLALAGAQGLYRHHVSAIWVLDVGHGDAILLRNGGQWVLVDCGDPFAGEAAVVPTLKRLGVRRLTAVIVTHPHADHAGGLAAVLEAVEVDAVIVNRCFSQSVWADGVEYMVIDRRRGLLPWLQLEAPGQWDYYNNMNLNDLSLVASVDLQHLSVLLTGDMEEAAEEALTPLLQPHNLLKVSHHGSRTSSSRQFLSRVQPSVAVISSALGCRHGFPHEEVLERLERAGATVYSTARDGYVQVVVWPWQRYSIFTFHSNNRR